MPLIVTTQDLVTPEDLADFPGAPFAASVVSAAASQVRDRAGWHIAPEVSVTVTVDGTTQDTLVLPTLRISTVAQVRDVSDPAAPVVLTGWQIRPGGMLYRRDGWPHGSHSAEVTMVHGFAACPDSLLPLLANLAQATAVNMTTASEKAGPFEVENADGADAQTRLDTAWSALDPYVARTGF